MNLKCSCDCAFVFIQPVFIPTVTHPKLQHPCRNKKTEVKANWRMFVCVCLCVFLCVSPPYKDHIFIGHSLHLFIVFTPAPTKKTFQCMLLFSLECCFCLQCLLLLSSVCVAVVFSLLLLSSVWVAVVVSRLLSLLQLVFRWHVSLTDEWCWILLVPGWTSGCLVETSWSTLWRRLQNHVSLSWC